jgi:3D (Asp-Asp-Asp) domain-containing protein
MQEETNIALLEDLVPTLPPVEEVVEELIEVESDEVVIEEEVIPEAEQIDLYDDITFLGYYNVTGYDPYCEHCCGKSDGITASGEVAQYNHTVAMNDLPFGTKIYIPYLGVYYVEDRGSSSVGVDIASIDHEACYAITASNQPVYIINS